LSKWLWASFAALTLGFTQTPAKAQAKAQAQTTQACPSSEAILGASLEVLALWAEACEDNAVYHAHKGSQLLALGQTEAAAIALEKALLLNPELAGAQLDFAQALAQIGLKGSARAILSGVLQRPDIQPQLKAQLSGATAPSSSNAASVSMASKSPSSLSPWSFSTLAQTAYGRESNLNGATYTDALTLYLSNGPVTLSLSDNAKPQPGMAFKTTLAGQAVYKAAGSQELLINAALGSRMGASSADKSLGANSQTAEGSIRYSLPMLAGDASGVWQLGTSTSDFKLSTASANQSTNQSAYQSAYQDRGLQLKYAWDSLGARCKWSPALGSVEQQFPQSTSLNGTYRFARVELLCSDSRQGQLTPGLGQQETHLAFGGGQDTAQTNSRPGGNRSRLDLLVRHEQLLTLGVFSANLSGQLTAWLRAASSRDSLPYSELLGDLKSRTIRQDMGLAFWWPIAQNWSTGINLEATSQRSNNTLFNLKNSTVYLGLRWAQD
jgi:tetratricopeptide (TPR) repeat protein